MEEDDKTVDDSGVPYITAHFFISGRDIEPSLVTNAVGIEPSEIWTQNHQSLRERVDLPTFCWMYGFKKKPLWSVTDAVEEVLDAVWRQRQQIQQFASSHDVLIGVECSITIIEERPVYELSPRAIKLLSSLGCGFSMDIFDYSGE